MFITENKNQFSSFYLTNSIPVVIKEVENSTTVAINLSIDGGDLLFATKNEVTATTYLYNMVGDILSTILILLALQIYVEKHHPILSDLLKDLC